MGAAMHTCVERVYVDRAGRRVPRDAAVAKLLYASAGAQITEDEARRLGLTSNTRQPQDDEPHQPDDEQPDDDEPADDEPADEGHRAHTCGVCGFEAASPAGLGAHQRTHEGTEL